MNGWTRQKYVYVPAFRVLGVLHVSRFAAAVKPTGPKPSSPESKSTSPFASGYAIPVVRLQGALQAVIVWKIVRLASRLTNFRPRPLRTRAGRPRFPVMLRSP